MQRPGDQWPVAVRVGQRGGQPLAGRVVNVRGDVAQGVGFGQDVAVRVVGEAGDYLTGASRVRSNPGHRAVQSHVLGKRQINGYVVFIVNL